MRATNIGDSLMRPVFQKYYRRASQWRCCIGGIVIRARDPFDDNDLYEDAWRLFYGRLRIFLLAHLANCQNLLELFRTVFSSISHARALGLACIYNFCFSTCSRCDSYTSSYRAFGTSSTVHGIRLDKRESEEMRKAALTHCTTSMFSFENCIRNAV